MEWGKDRSLTYKWIRLVSDQSDSGIVPSSELSAKLRTVRLGRVIELSQLGTAPVLSKERVSG